MSYCRWSSDDFQCDVYCYESDYGFETHVASLRPVFKSPLPPREEGDGWSDGFKRHKAVMQMVEEAARAPIGLAHDGESYTDATPGEAADRLETLRAAGYNVPQYAIDALREEAAAHTESEGR